MCRLPLLRLTLGRFLLASLELALPVLYPAFGLPTISGAVLSGTATSTAQRIVAAGTIAKVVQNFSAA
jgi:hypothetical protein